MGNGARDCAFPIAHDSHHALSANARSANNRQPFSSYLSASNRNCSPPSRMPLSLQNPVPTATFLFLLLSAGKLQQCFAMVFPAYASPKKRFLSLETFWQHEEKIFCASARFALLNHSAPSLRGFKSETGEAPRFNSTFSLMGPWARSGLQRFRSSLELMLMKLLSSGSSALISFDGGYQQSFACASLDVV